jgi:hypothetical protein
LAVLVAELGLAAEYASAASAMESTLCLSSKNAASAPERIAVRMTIAATLFFSVSLLLPFLETSMAGEALSQSLRSRAYWTK